MPSLFLLCCVLSVTAFAQGSIILFIDRGESTLFLQFIKDGDIKCFQVGLKSLRQAHYAIKTDN